jgi:transposase
MLDVSRGTVSKIMTAFERDGKTFSAKNRSGKKSKLSERDRRYLNRILRDNRKTTAVKITAYLNGHL